MRYFASFSIQDLRSKQNEEILGNLVKNNDANLTDLQRNSWLSEIDILRDQLKHVQLGHVFLEFVIPRLGKRIDAVVIIRDLLFIIEFKIGADEYSKYAKDQVIDYCLDLKNFHAGSASFKMFPILLSNKAVPTDNHLISYDDGLYELQCCNKDNLGAIIEYTLSNVHLTENLINPENWANSPYKPTPTIIEAAQALYSNHTVEDISTSNAGIINLKETTAAINSIIEKSKTNKLKSICFVTGVPGAGKTLAGLNIATTRAQINKDENAVFLSGNGPLVKVLREALARNESIRTGISKKDSFRKVESFIQNIHHFRSAYFDNSEIPFEKVAIFDEAQRAWDLRKLKNFMKDKKGIEDFKMSEPNFLISVMDRRTDWCVIICLVGGGQEIYDGEAGISEWFKTIRDFYPKWKIHYSDSIITDDVYINDQKLKEWILENGHCIHDLHLAVSARSFRSEKVAGFIDNLISVKRKEAVETYNEIKGKYPIVITRDLGKARQWILKNARGSERIGVIASSGGRRLKPLGFEVKGEHKVEEWFLNGKDDIRSSNFLEEVATEFDIQGLEIDWACLAWDGNLYMDNSIWNYQEFKGTKWQNIKSELKKKYLINTYRVLLTRSRQGLVIYIPEGSKEDVTRSPGFYDGTWEYFKGIGIVEI